MQKWYDCLPAMKKKSEIKKMYEERQKKNSQMIKSADGSAGLLHKITKPTARSTDFEEGRRRCFSAGQMEGVGEALAMLHESTMSRDLVRELKKFEEDLLRLEENDLANATKMSQKKQE